MENLKRAKASLILDHPFFASIVCNMPLIEDASIPTMAVNGESIRFNPKFVSELSVNETIFGLAHETMHCVFEDMFRRGNRDHALWNQATDYVINELLCAEKVGSMIQGALKDSQLVQDGGNTSFGVYEILAKQNSPDSNQPKPQPGEPGGSLDSCEDAPGDAAEKAEKQAENRVKIVQAANAAKACGKLSGGLARLVSDAMKPKVDWKSVLRRFLTERSKNEYSYARPNRRFLAEDISIPSLQGEKPGVFLIAVDCSGSINEKVLSAFKAEIRGIIEDTRPMMTHVVYFDSGISFAESYGPDDTLDIKPHGGGGTAFSPIWAYAEAQGIEPTACIVLTDLCCSDFGKPPVYPVLWASTCDNEAPFGEVLLISE